MNYQDVLDFWFKELKSEDWFSNNPDLDKKIHFRFKDVLLSAAKGELFHWRENAEGRLAEILVLDQFSRNIFRNSSKAFAQDMLALTLAQEMVILGLDKEIPEERRAFVYMPYMHSESPRIHDEAIELFQSPGLENNLEFEKMHKEIIDHFGRYPHRNEVLGRISSEEELDFLKSHKGF